ncbi:MAG TPA: SLBB domain-containing protein [Chitinophagales bacterium]|jgi:polysaccharide export outer membrane protein|nr:SLBB domain-containing protein [Chitinophagales bacterium]MBP6154846.1 SLBB domain-containing protein [Chitinophagales bacterium]HQV78274.1 SLBB domain-containing protein [Chitinophagales bacterium]HQW80154.1 SLBB domain-containing protein [Chitinophagales bacterium]
MRKLFVLCLFVSIAFCSNGQNFGNLTGSLNGAGITTAASNAAKQLQTMNSGNATSTNSLSQLQLLGLDPNVIQKYLKTKAESTQQETDNPIQGVLQTILELKSRQDSFQSVLDNQQKTIEANNNVKPNEIFGHDFFGTGKLALFAKSSEAKAPDSYILDAGDEISIAVWGYADYNNKLKVSEDGFIQIPEFGRIYVKGLSFGAVKSQIGKRLATFINPANTKYEITLNYARTIDVNIVGEVKTPGTYQIPAINSVYNAINAANGITNIGSVRDIQIRRDGKTIKRLDVYEFLFNPLSQENFYLQKGDFIYVSTQNKLIKITGAVRRPAKYELLTPENLNELIKFAGGFAPDAYIKSVQITRTNGDQSKILNVNYEDILTNHSNVELKDGDEVTISTIPGGIENFVSISGTIRYPGKYELKEGFRISDIIKASGGIRLETYIDRAYIKRKMDDNTNVIQKFSLNNILLDENSADNLLLKKFDQIQLFSKDDFIEKFNVTIDGSVIKPTSMEYTNGLNLNDLLFYAGGLKKEAANSKIEISRVMNVDSSLDKKFIPQRIVVQTITIGPNLEIDDASKAFLLSPMDRIFVRKEYGFDEQMTVTIKGEVKYPGIYPILDKNEKVLDLIERAGGLTPYAFIKNAKLTRPENKLDKTIFQLKDAFNDSSSRANLILKNGDEIEIPTVNQLVSIQGAIRYPNLDSTQTINGKYVPGKSARWYIKHYGGGFKKGALKKSTMVIYPNRKVDYTRTFMGIKNYPTVDIEGATITVDMKVKKPKPPKGPESALNWNIILPSMIAAFTSIATTLTLIFVLKK